MITTVNKTGQAAIDGLLGEYKWASVALSYSFPDSSSDYPADYPGDRPTTGFYQLNAQQQGAAGRAFALLSSYTKLTFTATPAEQDGEALLRLAGSSVPKVADAFPPQPHFASGDSWYSEKISSPIVGNHSHVTFLHEIGHTIGLKHPHDGSATVPAHLDSHEYSVMSYKSYVGSTEELYVNERFGYPQTFMMLDIAALQHLYGANFDYNAGNTTYSWDKDTGAYLINGIRQWTPGANRVFMTLWDGGGVDTYDLSNYGTGVSIDLRPGAWTVTSAVQLANLGNGNFARGNVANALLFNGDPRSLIENAVGGAGNDTVIGNEAANFISLQHGGNDTVSGGAGDDGFYFGAALTAEDVVDGGEGSRDQVGLQGNYAGLTLGARNLVGVETLVLLSGSDARFGDSSGASYSYNLTTVDENVAAGGRLTVNMNTLRAGENVTFNGSAESNGSFLFFGGFGTETLVGGAASDGFYFGTGRFGSGDTVTGGAGADDQVGLQGNFSGANAIAFGASQLVGIETIAVLSGSDNRFGGASGATFSYDLTLNNGNIAAGGVLTINGNRLASGEFLKVNGSAETDGRLQIFSGAGADTLIGSAGDDRIFGGGGNDAIRGGLGADTLSGGAGDDTFVYGVAGESTASGRDSITDFSVGDRIDLSGIDANSGSDGDQAFSFVGANAFSGTAGELRAYQADAGGWIVEADLNGDSIADLVIGLTTINNHQIGSGDFIL